MMHRIHELAVQAANDTNTQEGRECLDDEIQMYKEELTICFGRQSLIRSKSGIPIPNIRC